MTVSLADFDPKDVIAVRWYNVLSFRFMQLDSNVPSNNRTQVSEISCGEHCETLTITQTETIRQMETSHFVSSEI